MPRYAAVQHAHTKGIIHRDLKPSNILVTMQDGKPTPKVIDFGVAKALHNKLADQTIYTEIGQVMGTLEYMAPEQAELSAMDIDTRADVYALGVILYELLVGSTPITTERLRNAAFVEVIRIIKEEEPPKPSTRLSYSSNSSSLVASVRRTEPNKLRAVLASELDWVVLKALEKDRTRRYETANALKRDIDRYLADEAVEARPPSNYYLLSKFYRRHRALARGALLVIGCLLAGIVGTTWQAYRAINAESNWRNAALEAKENENKARWERDEKEKSRQEEMRQKKLAEKSAQEAKEQLAIATAIRVFLQRKLLGHADSRFQADTYAKSGTITKTATLNPTIRELLDRTSDELSEENIEKNFPQQPLLQAELLQTVGDAYRGVGAFSKAIQFLNRAVAVRLKYLGERDSETVSSINNLALACQSDGKLAEAIKWFEKARELSLKTEWPDSIRALGIVDNLAGAYVDIGNYKQAIQLYEKVFEVLNGKNGIEHVDTLITMNNLARAYHKNGDSTKAMELYSKAYQGYLKKLGAEHPDTLVTHSNLALMYDENGRSSEAIAIYEKVRDSQVKILGAEDPDTLSNLNNLGVAYFKAKRFQDAIAILEQVKKGQANKLGSDHPSTLGTSLNLGAIYLHAKQPEDSIRTLEKAREDAKKFEKTHPITIQLMNNLAFVYLSTKQYSKAVSYFNEVCEVMLEMYGPNDAKYLVRYRNLIEAQSKLAEEMLSRKDFAQAESLLLKSYDGITKRGKSLAQANSLKGEIIDLLVRLYTEWGKSDDAAKWSKLKSQ
ncbi:MAG: tetratricopeptide repeat protein [Gemmatales bacterium]